MKKCCLGLLFVSERKKNDMTANIGHSNLVISFEKKNHLMLDRRYRRIEKSRMIDPSF